MLLPSLVGTAVATDGGAAADTPVDQTAQIGFLDELFGGDDDEDDDDGGFFASLFGSDEESFDGYPDGFSADGIEDFDQAVGTDSTHYNADSMRIDATMRTAEGAFDVQIAASGGTRTAEMTSQTPDGAVVRQYVTGETVYIATENEYAQEERAFTREEFYGIDEFLSELEGMDLEEAEIDGDTVVYTTTEDEDADIELAVADTGELDYLRGTADDVEIDMEFSDYDTTSVDEPVWVDQAREQAEEPDDHEIEPPERPDRDPRDTREESDDDRQEIRHEIRAQEPGEVTVAIHGGGTTTAEPGETRVLRLTPSDDTVVRVIMPDRTEQFEAGADERLVLRYTAIEESRDRNGGADDREDIHHSVQAEEPGAVTVDIRDGGTYTTEPGETRVTRVTPSDDTDVRVIMPDRTERIEVGADERLVLRTAALEESRDRSGGSDDREEIQREIHPEEPGEVTVDIRDGGTYTAEPGESRTAIIAPPEDTVVRVTMPDRTERIAVGADEQLELQYAALEESRERDDDSDDREEIRHSVQAQEPGEVTVDIRDGGTHTAEPGESRVTRVTPTEDTVVRITMPDRTERIAVSADERLILRYSALEE